MSREEIVITLAEVHGSAPREVGTKMLVWARGQSGTIGGGELEYRLCRQAREMLLDDSQLPVLAEFPLGPVLGQCCGGFVRVLMEKNPKQPINSQQMAVQTCLQTGNKSLLHPTGPKGSVEIIDKQQFVIEQPSSNLPRVYIFGGGHIGTALELVLQQIELELHWIDSRSGLAQNVQIADNPVAVAEAAPANSLFVILTHSHDLDYQLCRCILQKKQLWFCGLIGSQTKRARFLSRLSQDGLTEKQIQALTCPLGLPGIGGKHPSEIAVAIAGQILQQMKASPNGN